MRLAVQHPARLLRREANWQLTQERQEPMLIFFHTPHLSQPKPKTEPAFFNFPLNDFFKRATTDFGMTEIQTDILAVLRTQEAALLAVLETVRQAIQTMLTTQTDEALDGMKTETTDVERRLMNQVLAELGVQFTSADIFERAKKLKPGMKRDFLKRAVIRLELSGAIRKIEAGRGRRPARYQKRFFN